jgi:uncharacterized protein
VGQRRTEFLNRAECLRLVGACKVGRVGLTMQGVPHIVPVNHVIIDGDLYFHMGSGSKLDAGGGHHAASFEVDQLDDDTETGWSVLLSGELEVETDERRLAELDGLGLEPWARGPKGTVMRLRTVTASGRRITT